MQRMALMPPTARPATPMLRGPGREVITFPSSIP
jgi:hypothetical protein